MKIKRRHITKRERIFLIWVQVFCLMALMFFFILKCDRWFYDGTFHNYLHLGKNVDYKFPLLDSYWQRCSYTDFAFAFFLVDWFANIGVILGVFTRKYLVSGISSFILFICCLFSVPNIITMVFTNCYEYLGYDPVLDLMMYVIGYIATTMFMTFEVEGFYDYYFGDITDDPNA